MTNSFWFSTDDGEIIIPPAVEPSYDVKESIRFDGEDNKMSRTPSTSDAIKVGEIGPIQAVIYNSDNTVTLQVDDGVEPYQSLSGGYLQVGDTLTQTTVGGLSTSTITTASTPYVIGDSVIFDSDSSSYLDRTFSSVGNETTATCSFWLKRGTLGTTQYIFGSSSTETTITFNTSDKLSGNLRGTGGTNYSWATSAVFRDPSAWYHVVTAWDSSQGTASDRFKIYVNGVLQTLSTAQYCPQNTVLFTNDTRKIGTHSTGISYFDGYLADIQFVDGYAHEPTAFGEYNSNGVWVPKAADLTRLDPYDTRPNMEQEWSDVANFTLSGSNNNNIGNLFNGQVGDIDINPSYGIYPLYGNNNQMQINVNYDFGIVEKLRIYADNSGSNGGVFKVNGNDYSSMLAGNFEGWLDIPETSLQLIELGYVGGTTAVTGVCAIEVDGRILVDGPADNSQMWSNYLSSNTSVVDGGNAFDGNTSTNGMGWDGIFNAIPPAGFYDLVFEPPTPIAGPVSVFLNTAPGSGYNNGWQVDTGSGYTALDYSYAQSSWVEIVPAGQSLVKFRMQSDQNGTSFAAMKYGSDDKILIDAPAKWDTSQVWSNGASWNTPVTSPELLFDGDMTTVAISSGAVSTLTFSPGISYTNTVEVLSDSGSGSSDDLDFTANGQPLVSTRAHVWTTIATGGGSLTSILFTNNGSGATTTRWKGLKVDGKILVDGLYGYNGFHLDFSSAQLGNDSSGLDNDFTAHNLFGATLSIQGYNGGDSYVYAASNSGGGGGGGAGGPGLPSVSSVHAGDGGPGRLSNITGSAVYYGGGGGGGSWGTAGGVGGIGGGGAGKLGGFSTGPVNPGTNGLGGGGGGAGYASSDWQDGGVGGSGRVIIRYPSSYGTLVGGAESSNLTTVDGDYVYQFTSVGTGVITFPSNGDISVQYLVLGGGGGAETGGGGGGGMIEGTILIPSGSVQTVTVGAGGVGATSLPNTLVAASNGGISQFATITALGGGRGGGGDTGAAPGDGGTGGGGGTTAGNIDGGLGTGGEESDKVLDSPIGFINADGDSVGNYCTWNALDSQGTLKNGNLTFTSTDGDYRNARSTIGVSSGKWYWEATVTNLGSAAYVGIGTSEASLTSNIGAANTWGYTSAGTKGAVNTPAEGYGSAYTTGHVIGVALDADNGTLTFYNNGTSQGVAYRGLTADVYFPMVTSFTGTIWEANFGQKPFIYTPPDGYKALCLTNL